MITDAKVFVCLKGTHTLYMEIPFNLKVVEGADRIQYITEFNQFDHASIPKRNTRSKGVEQTSSRLRARFIFVKHK